VHPIAFHLGRLTVHWYGVLLAVAFLTALWAAARRAPRNGIAPETISDAGLWLILGAVLGARSLYVISYWDDLMRDPLFPGAPWTEMFMVQRGGLVYYGGLLGSALACILFANVRKLALWKLADVLAPSVALGYVFGRIGCLFNGCCFGRACSLPWALHFPEDHATGGAPVHPTQIYDSLLSLGLYAALAWLYRRKQFDGQVFAVYLIAYALTRSVVEAFRGDYSAVHRHAGLTPAHLISIGIFTAGMILFAVLRRRANSTK